MLTLGCLILAAQAGHHAHVPAERPAVVARPANLGPVDVEISLGVRRGQLRYDREFLLIKPGARARLRLSNVDDMLHNWVLCAVGTDLDALATAALQLGADAMAKDFVPPSDRVLCYAPIVGPSQATFVDFVAPTTSGDYPFVCTLPGHATTMRGVLRVCASGTPIAALRYRCYEGAFERLPDFDGMTAVKAGDLTDGLIDVGVAARDRDFALVFEGSLDVVAAGLQRFHLDSDDGARVLIDGAVVVERDGVHPAGQEKTGDIELERGAHALRVEFFQRKGDRVLRLAWSNAAGRRMGLTHDGQTDAASRQELFVLQEAIVQRAFVEGGPERAIAVGLPGGVSACFDAERCCVAFAWRGGFLDVAPDRLARGGQACRIVGQRFAANATRTPPQIDGESGAARFLGYRVAPQGPTFSFAVGAHRVEQRLSATDQGGLRSTFAITGEPSPVTLTLAREGLSVSASAGRWEGDVLHLSAAQATEFSVTFEAAR